MSKKGKNLGSKKVTDTLKVRHALFGKVTDPGLQIFMKPPVHTTRKFEIENVTFLNVKKGQKPGITKSIFKKKWAYWGSNPGRWLIRPIC